MRRLIATLALLALLSACGGGSDGSGSTGGDDTSSSGADASAAAVPDDVCAAVPAADVSSATGLTLTGEAVPGGGCSYEQDDPRATSVSISAVEITDENGGFEGSVTGAKGVLSEVTSTDVDGIGEDATILTGTLSGMGSQVTTGLVDLGGVAVLVQVLGGDTATHADLAEKTMKVAADALA